MISFKAFLSEDFSRGLSLEDAEKYIKNNCSKNFNFAVKNNVALWRMQNEISHSLALLPERAEARGSATLHNTMNDYVAKSPDWKDFPDRRFSLSCGTYHYNIKVSKSDLFAVIPFDSVSSYGVSPVDFNFLEVDLDEAGSEWLIHLQYDLRDWCETTKNPMPKISMKNGTSMDLTDSHNIDLILKFTKSLRADLAKLPDDYEDGDETELPLVNVSAIKIKRAKSFSKIHTAKDLYRLLSPKTLKVSHFSAFDQLPFSNLHAEVWFRGPCLLIRNVGDFNDSFNKVWDFHKT